MNATISAALLFVSTAAIAGDAYKAATAPPAAPRMPQLATASPIPTARNCYFMRVLKPLPQDNENAQPIPKAEVPDQPRIVPLQSRIRGFGSEAVCSPIAQLRKAH
jgi:hypothetical protein